MQVLLIGGGASVGKTTLAGELAKRWRAADVLHVDDIRHQHQGAIDHLSDPAVWDLDPRELLGLLLEMTASIREHLVTIIDRLAAAGRPAILEGEGIEPEMLDVFDGDDRIRAAYIVEDDPAVLRRTFSLRESSGRFNGLAGPRQAAVVEMNRLYGEHLRASSAGRPHPCLSSQPWPTLPYRVRSATRLS